MASNNNNIISGLPSYLRPAAKFVRKQESPKGLSTTRFIQGMATGLLPRSIFARSKEDMAEIAFVEILEGILVYYMPAILGQHLFRKIFTNKMPENLKKEISTSGVELIKKNNKSLNKKVLPAKAAISLAALIIPLTEFCLNYFKNLMTLKVFKVSDFKNIASLDSHEENKEQQKKVEKSAKRHIGMAAAAYAGSLALAALTMKRGKNSKGMQNLSEFILAPGTKLFKKKPKAEKFFNKYFSLDFANQDGKLTLSKGQLTISVLLGGLGYFGASADRGPENLKETATRLPFVMFYVITGSELLEKGFKKLLKKAGKCKDLIRNDLSVPTFDGLDELAKKISKERGEDYNKVLTKLSKQKILISGFPFVFSLGVMGFFMAGMTNYFTRKRYESAKSGNSNTKNV